MPVDGSVILDPVIDYLGPLETPTFSQLPAQGPVRKVLVIFVPRASEGSGPEVFWDRVPNCPSCTGLPESRSIVIDALTRNYAVLAPTSLNVPDGDWTTQAWPADSPDLNNVELVITEWKKKYGLENTPFVGIGMSAGGQAVSSLGLRDGLFESVTVMISGGVAEAWQSATEKYPPTLFINMPKDDRTAAEIAFAKPLLFSKGVATNQLEWYEKPLTPDWFEVKIPGVSLALSTVIVDALRDAGLMVGDSNFLLDDTLDYDWQSSLRLIMPDDPLNIGKFMFEDMISQEMKVAMAKHVTLSRLDEELFDWFDGAYKDVRQTLSTDGPI